MGLKPTEWRLSKRMFIKHIGKKTTIYAGRERGIKYSNGNKYILYSEKHTLFALENSNPAFNGKICCQHKLTTLLATHSIYLSGMLPSPLCLPNTF